MTRLIPTRDRAQATRFPSFDAAVSAMQEVTGGSTIQRVETVDDTPGFIVQVADPFPRKFWSGPWYVREVAE